MTGSLELVTLAARHARELRRQVGKAKTLDLVATASKATMVAALQAAELEFLLTAAMVAPADRSRRRVCGVWTLHDVVGHLADWDKYFVNWLASLTGRRVKQLHLDDDGDRFNASLVAKRSGDSWEQAWADCRRNRQTLHERLEEVPAKRFLAEQADGPFPTVYHCAWSALEHYLDHAAGIRRHLELAMPAELLSFHGPYSG